MQQYLMFVPEGKKWQCPLTSKGKAVVQLKRSERGLLSIVANLPDMEPVSVCTKYADKDVIFEVDIPIGVEYTIQSWSKVQQASILSNG